MNRLLVVALSVCALGAPALAVEPSPVRNGGAERFVVSYLDLEVTGAHCETLAKSKAAAWPKVCDDFKQKFVANTARLEAVLDWCIAIGDAVKRERRSLTVEEMDDVATCHVLTPYDGMAWMERVTAAIKP